MNFKDELKNYANIINNEIEKKLIKDEVIEKKLNKVIGIMLDIPGPCIRLDNLKSKDEYLPIDKEIRFYNYHVVCNNTQLSTNCQNLIEYIKSMISKHLA